MRTTTTNSTDFCPSSSSPFRTAQFGVGVSGWAYRGPNRLRNFHENRRPHLEGKDALKLEVGHFLQSRGHKREPRSGSPEGLRLIRMLEAAPQSLRLKGQPIPL